MARISMHAIGRFHPTAVIVDALEAIFAADQDEAAQTVRRTLFGLS